MSPTHRTLILSIDYDEAFAALDDELVRCFSAPSLIFAAVAFLIYDDDFYVSDLIDKDTGYDNQLLYWIERFGDANPAQITYLKDWARSCGPTFHLASVEYSQRSGDLSVSVIRTPDIDPNDSVVWNVR